MEKWAAVQSCVRATSGGGWTQRHPSLCSGIATRDRVSTSNHQGGVSPDPPTRNREGSLRDQFFIVVESRKGEQICRSAGSGTLYECQARQVQQPGQELSHDASTQCHVGYLLRYSANSECSAGVDLTRSCTRRRDSRHLYLSSAPVRRICLQTVRDCPHHRSKERPNLE